jgi:iron complex transport system ATP-binding protein
MAQRRQHEQHDARMTTDTGLPVDLAVELIGLSVEVPGTEILKQVSWCVPVGGKAAILGPNGSGKSTLLRAITAYGHFTSGCVRVLGHQLGSTHVHDLRRRLGIVDPTLFRLLDPGATTEQLVATGLFGHLTTYFDRPTPEQLQLARSALQEVGLANQARQPVETLSSGQLSRAWLARALVHTPDLLILDEPAAGLDLLGRETLLASLSALLGRRRALTVIMVTHHLEDLLPETDNVLLLGARDVVAVGPPQEVLTSANLSQAFGCPVQSERSDGRWRWSVSPLIWDRLLP